MPQIIQFTHPGLEHGPDNGSADQKSWNTGAHRRKFMLCNGDYVSDGTLVRDENLLFWGEWEPPSRVDSLPKTQNQRLPRWLHTPYRPAYIPVGGASSCAPGANTCNPVCGEGALLQNTDPFVFEDAFKYMICKQTQKNHRRRTGLASLEEGSMILFGSTAGRKKDDAFFQLDTVFVVAKVISYDPSDLESLRTMPEISELYDELVISKVFTKPLKQSVKLSLYLGATYDHPVNGMYSFSPARVCEATPVGFTRVKLEKSTAKGTDFITNNLNSSPKRTPATENEVKEAWINVRAESRKQGCVEGVRFSVVGEL
jgi:hypothetical protein